MKLSKTQQALLDKCNAAHEFANRYNSYAELFDNATRKDTTYFTTGSSCNGAYTTREKYRAKDPEGWARMERHWELIRNEKIFQYTFAKTETIDALVKAGKIEVLEEPAFKGGAETIRVL